jgi:hypothetical protein
VGSSGMDEEVMEGSVSSGASASGEMRR